MPPIPEKDLGWMDSLIDLIFPKQKCYKVYWFLKAVLYFCRFNFGKLGFWFPWSVVLLVLAVALFTYIALLLVRTENCSRALQYGFLLMLMLCWCCAGPGRVPSLWRTEALPPLEPQGDQRSVSSSFIVSHICIHPISVLPEKQLQMIHRLCWT